MLPKDTKQRKQAALENKQNSLKGEQSLLSDHFKPEDHNVTRATATPYHSKDFETSALEWLVDTNQVR